MPLFCIAIGKNLEGKLECLREKLPPNRLNPGTGKLRIYCDTYIVMSHVIIHVHQSNATTSKYLEQSDWCT